MSKFYYNGETNIVTEVVEDDSWIESPRKAYDHRGTMLTWERDYASPDENDFETPDDFKKDLLMRNCPARDLLQEIKDGKVPDVQLDLSDPADAKLIFSDEVVSLGSAAKINAVINDGALGFPDDLKDALCDAVIWNNGNWRSLLQTYAIVMPIYKLDHSGITYSVLNFNDPWDSGQCGYIYVEDWKKINGRSDIVCGLLADEVEEYSNWVEGRSAEIYDYDLSFGSPDGGDFVGSEICYDYLEYEQNLSRTRKELGEYESLRACLDDNLGLFPTVEARDSYFRKRAASELENTLGNMKILFSDSDITAAVDQIVKDSHIWMSLDDKDKYITIDRWSDDGTYYAIGRANEQDGQWYEARVYETDSRFRGHYVYEFGQEEPSKDMVESHHIDRLSEIEGDRAEAGAMGDLLESFNDYYAREYDGEQIDGIPDDGLLPVLSTTDETGKDVQVLYNVPAEEFQYRVGSEIIKEESAPLRDATRRFTDYYTKEGFSSAVTKAETERNSQVKSGSDLDL